MKLNPIFEFLKIQLLILFICGCTDAVFAQNKSNSQSIGLEVGGISGKILKADGNQAPGPEYDDISFGFYGKCNYELHLNRSFGFNLGLGITARPGSGLEGFGGSFGTSYKVQKRLYYLSFPTTLQLKTGEFLWFEIGLEQLIFLFINDNINRIDNSAYSLDKEEISPYHISATIGARFNINQNLSLSIGYFQSLTSVAENDVSGQSSTISASEYSTKSFSLGMRYTFFSFK